MRKRITLFLTAVILSVTASAAAVGTAPNGTISIDAAKPGPRIPASLYGIFFEEISHAGEGGLYAEMIRNRGFEDANLPPASKLENGSIVPPRTPHFWRQPQVSDWKMRWQVTSNYPAWSLDAT